MTRPSHEPARSIKLAYGMLMRLITGLLKGTVLGAGVGVALQVGLGWAPTTGLLGYLLAMGVGASVGLLGGKPPWRTDGWIELLLKGLFGVGVGALVYYVGASYVHLAVPFALPAAPAGTDWASQPLLFGPLVGALFGTVVELDNSPDGGGDESSSPSRKPKRSKKSRAIGLGEDDDFALPRRKKKA